jgi:hypothetical protein
VSDVDVVRRGDTALLISASDDASVRTWNLHNGVCEDLTTLPEPPRAMATDPAGRLVIGFGWDVVALESVSREEE